MARKGKRRNFNLRRVRVNASIGAGALAPVTVTSGSMTDAVSDPMRFISLHASYAWGGKQVADDGCTFGVAHSDYTAAEIEECLEETGAMDIGDKIAQEKANRLVREIGQISGGDSAAGGIMFNDGKPVKTRLNWFMSTGDSLQLWIRNASGVVWTTGSTITIAGNLWVKDC